MMLRKLLEDKELGMKKICIDKKKMRNVYTSINKVNFTT
jgi:hypothetical protein